MTNETPEVKNESEAQNLCKRGCGFYGSVQFRDMCSKCYQEQSKEEASVSRQSSLVLPPGTVDMNGNPSQSPSTPTGSCVVHAAAVAASSRRTNPASSADNTSTMRTGSGTPLLSTMPRPLKRKAPATSPITTYTEVISDAPTPPSQSRVNRCSWCRKRVGLTGFSCRCNGLFCSLHRYSDQHECSFDYQAQGRMELTKANPEIRCPKIRKL